MVRVFGTILRLPGRIWATVRRRPLLTGVSLLVLLVVTAVGLWRYALSQWRAAEVAVREDRLADATRRIDLCLTVWPRSPAVHLLAARAARLNGDLETTEAHLNRCLQLQGGASEAVQLEFLMLRVQTGEVDEVAPALIDAVENGHPDGPAILRTLARAYMHRLRYQMAWSCLTRWTELRPDDATAYHWRGWVLERLDNHKAAYADYHRALELDPDLVPVRLRVAEMLIDDNQAPEALPHLERLYRQVPENPQVLSRLGACRLLQGRTDEARRLLEAALVHLPHDPALLVSLASLELQEGRGPEAERWLRTILKEEPSDTEALFVLVSALQLQGRSEESAAALKNYERTKQTVERVNTLLTTVVEKPTAKADDLAETGRLLLEIGREKLGTYWLEQAVERDPGNQQAHRAWAAFYERKGDTANAAAHRRMLREPGPETKADTNHPPVPDRPSNP